MSGKNKYEAHKCCGGGTYDEDGLVLDEDDTRCFKAERARARMFSTFSTGILQP